MRQFLDLGATPLADDFPSTPDPDALRWPLGAAVCESCRLVQLTEVVPDDVLWGGDYGFHTSGSPSQREYFRRYALDAERRVAQAGVDRPFGPVPLVVEVACNDGTLLQHFDRPNGWRPLGVDPAKGPAEAARAKGLDVWQEPFGRSVAGRIVAEHGPATLVIANNVLAHVADLDDFVGGLALLLAPDGVLSVEVQYLGDLLLGNGFDLLYHEHRSFFTVSSLAPLFRRHDLSVVGVQRTPAQGGSIRITAAHRPGDRTGAMSAWRRREDWAYDEGAYGCMQARAEMVRDRLRDLIDAERSSFRTVVGYGAPAKATTLLHWCGLTSSADVEVVYDATPSKDGRYMPGTDIPIIHRPTLSYLNADSTAAILLSHNYLPRALRREREFLDAGGGFVVPLPVPAVI